MEDIDIDTPPVKQKNKKVIIIVSISILIIIILAIILTIFFLTKDNNNDIDNEVSDNQNELDTPITNTNTNFELTNKIYEDYRDGNISTDEYVRYLLYAEFDRSLLDEKYLNLPFDLSVHSEDLIDKYYNELSTENTMINLNQVLLSKNGNFIIWYTTTGDSKTTKENAKKIGDSLEKAVEQCKNLFNLDFKYSPNIFSKGKNYTNQLNILKANDINENYINSAMPIYLVNYGENSSITQYRGKSKFLTDLYNKFLENDVNGSIMYPYLN